LYAPDNEGSKRKITRYEPRKKYQKLVIILMMPTNPGLGNYMHTHDRLGFTRPFTRRRHYGKDEKSRTCRESGQCNVVMWIGGLCGRFGVVQWPQSAQKTGTVLKTTLTLPRSCDDDGPMMIWTTWTASHTT